MPDRGLKFSDLAAGEVFRDGQDDYLYKKFGPNSAQAMEDTICLGKGDIAGFGHDEAVRRAVYVPRKKGSHAR